MVEEDGVALGVVEGGAVGVVDEDLELEGDVEFDADDREGDTGEDAIDAGGDELHGWIVGLEEGEVENQGDDAEEEEKEEAGAAQDEAAPSAAAAVERGGGGGGFEVGAGVAGFSHEG